MLGFTVLGFQPGNIKETAGILLESGWYWCDGSNKNRVTDAPLFNAITIQQNGVLNGTAVVTGLTDTSNMSPGMPVSGIGVPASTVIQSVDSGTQVTMNQNATTSATVPLVFAPYGVGDGANTFGLPNRVYGAVGRDNASGTAANVTQVSTTITLTSGNNSATVASATGLFVGMWISTPKVPFSTKIASISGTTITMTNNATASVGPVAARFSPLFDAQTMGATGGALNQTLVTANLPAYTPAGGITNGAITSTVTGGIIGGTSSTVDPGPGSITVPSNATSIVVTSSQATSTFAGAAQGGTSAPFCTVQPTIVMNFMIKR